MHVPNKGQGFKWEPVLDAFARARAHAHAKEPPVDEWAPAPAAGFARVIIARIEREGVAAASAHLVLADESYPWHRIYFAQFARWGDVQVRTVVSQRGGKFETTLTIVLAPHTQVAVDQEEARLMNTLSSVRAAAAAKEAEEKKVPRDSRGNKRSPKQRREQLQQQRQHARRHNGR